ncbi:alpha/beta hydrolase [Bryobacter aggregatus]|uniref:alpha/beta hydrolase n=1 Tax=Bryobacter aggregatus TaxID=360054 RepID=UPI000690574A|nr:alpha/beta hydrolase-fold protein [Bryobacter aggregatus]
MRPFFLTLISALVLFAQKPEPAAVLKMAAKPASPEFQKNLEASFTPQQLEKGEASLAVGPDSLYAIKAAKPPQLFVDDQPAGAMKKAGAYYIGTAKIAPYTSHTYHYMIDGKRFGGRFDVIAFGPEAYEQAGVPQGKLSEKFTSNSKIYEGMASEYWVYVPAQYNAATPAPVMIWQDGQNYANRAANNRVLIQIDNLVHQKRIPAAIHIFIAPGKVGAKAMRSILYDTYTDKYSHYLLEEILAEVSSKWNLRKDGYSRAIAGESSGAICAFNAAWWRPEEFTRVYSRIGSYTSIQWKPGELDGGNIYPFAIRKMPKRNIRAFLSDGSEDIENNHGSWPLQNIQMANSLKLREYDFRFVFGTGAHSTAQGHAEIPIALPWIWRGYDPAKTSEEFVMDPAEKEKPYFRVKALNRN